MKLRSGILVAASAAALVAASSGCSYFVLGHAPPCMPPAFSVSPSSAEPGENVVVAAPNADCDPRYGDEAEIRVWVTDAAGEQVLDAIAPMNDAGGFSYVFEVPLDAASGPAAVSAVPHDVDWCDDTGRNNRVATETDAVVLERAGCVLPTQRLFIEGPPRHTMPPFPAAGTEE